jgi:hypothetical protein
MELSIYSPLSHENREIRLVRILSSFDKCAPIRCTTSKISLNKSQGYYALSYAWGDPTVTVPIFVDDVEIQVTTNLEAACRHFRPKELPTLYPELGWWIDAICINQSDPAERSHQVQLMRDIYSHASIVTVWLGEEQDDSRLAIETIDGLTRDFEEKRNRETALEAINKLQGKAAFKAIISFFERPWWLRLWTVQEYVFAKEILFACGETCFSWTLLHWWSHIITAKMDPSEWKVKEYDFLQLISTQGCAAIFAKSFLRKQLLANKSIQENLSDILAVVDCMLCSDPRDRIYGIQGLASDGNSFGLPDYTISISALYIKVATIMVQIHQDLTILHYTPPHSSAAPDGVVLPSWVPDWTRAGYPRPLDDTKYSAAKGRKALSRFGLPLSPVLCAQGVVWDTVTRLEKPEPEHPISRENTLGAAAQKRRKELFAVYQNRCDETGSPVSVNIYRDNCYGAILDEHYHCSICEDGHFDLCQGCVEDGVLCGGDDHCMIKRYINNGEVITSNTESLELKNICNESKTPLVDGKLLYIP